MDINEFCNNISYASVHEEGKPGGGMNRHLHNHDRSLRWDRHDETSVVVMSHTHNSNLYEAMQIA